MNRKTLFLLILAHASYALTACTSRTVDGRNGDGDGDDSCNPAIACEAFACQIATACEEDAEGNVDCTYEDAADASVCDLSAPQSADGVCASGTCVAPPCGSNSECPGDETCVGGTCAAQGGMGASCDSGDDEDCGEGLLCGASNTCIGDTGTACSDNVQCQGTCVDGLCAPPGSLGDACDAGDVADCDTGYSCSGAGVCVANDGGTCSSNDDCVNVCIGSVCGPAAPLGDPCDESDDGDCQSGLSCSTDNTCLGNNGQSCTDNAQCLNACIANTCADTSGDGGTCDADDSADCQSGLECGSDDTCLRGDGQSCTNNAQCLNTCIGGSCGTTSEIGGTCDPADDGDCIMGTFCGGGDTCVVVDGGSCSDNGQCDETCIAGTCTSPSDQGGVCDTGDHTDCAATLECGSADTCALGAGSECTANQECAQTCIANSCGDLASAGSTCDPGDPADCAIGGCVGGTCGGSVTGSVFVFEVVDYLDDNLAAIHEIQFFDTSDNLLAISTTDVDAYDVTQSDVPVYWTSDQWGRGKLTDGTSGYGSLTSTALLFDTSGGNPGGGEWARFAVFIDAGSTDIGKIAMSLGNTSWRVPREVRVYRASSYDLNTNLVSRQDSGMTLLWAFTTEKSVEWGEVRWHEVAF